MAIFDVVLLTDSRYVNPASPGQYVQNILKEDEILQKALEKYHVSVTRKDWADPAFDWTSAKLLLFRSTWDYFDRLDEFRKWLKEVSAKTLLINTPDIIWWNMDKKYLGELHKKGVRIIPTQFIEKGAAITLSDLHSKAGWQETVLKPTVGGGGRYTYRLNKAHLTVHEKKFQTLIAEEDFMLQPFQQSILNKGEWSLMFFNDTYSHAVLKKARQGDFRVQDDFGGTVHPYEASQKEINFALQAINACPTKPIYARVDMVQDNEEELAISELELIEPELWFRLKPEAADLLASEVINSIENL